MSDTSPSNAKIYERAEKKSPSPLLLVVGVLFLLIAGFVAYRFLVHPTDAPTKTSSVTLSPPVSLTASWRDSVIRMPVDTFIERKSLTQPV